MTSPAVELRQLGGRTPDASTRPRSQIGGQEFKKRSARLSVPFPGQAGLPGCGVDFGVACSAYVSDEAARLMPPR